MKDLYYATKIDKNKNKLTASYLTQKNREKYNKGASFKDGVLYANFQDGRLTIGEESGFGFVMRGLLVNNGEIKSSGSGDFVLHARVAGKWSETPFRFPTYSAANTAMKAMIGEYEALLIRDESGTVDDDVDDEYEDVNGNLTIGE